MTSDAKQAKAANNGRSRSIEPGAQFGPYTILKQLAEGGVGGVYLAAHRVLGRKAALKIIKQLEAEQEDFERRLGLEARALSEIRHPNMVMVYDAGVEHGIPWMALEFVEGTNLRELLVPGQPLSVEQTIQYAADIAAGVQAAHDLRVIHRDLKPENVMVTQTGRVVVLDLGIAKFLDSSKTKTQFLMGTVAYMSPEHLLWQEVDGRSDLYSLAVMIYEMLAGFHPYATDRHTGALPDQSELARLHIQHAPKPLPEVAPWVQTLVWPPLARALSKDRAQRPNSMVEFVNELKQAVSGNAPGASLAGPSAVQPLNAGYPQQTGLESGLVGRSSAQGREATMVVGRVLDDATLDLNATWRPDAAPPAAGPGALPAATGPTLTSDPLKSEVPQRTSLKPVLVSLCLAGVLGAALLVYVFLPSKAPPQDTRQTLSIGSASTITPASPQSSSRPPAAHSEIEPERATLPEKASQAKVPPSASAPPSAQPPPPQVQRRPVRRRLPKKESANQADLPITSVGSGL